MLIVDLGCNVGETMRDFALQYPAAKIVGVELDERVAQEARNNLVEFGDRCLVVGKAIGWPERNTTAWIDITSTVSTVTPYQLERINTTAHPKEMHIYTLDSVLAELGLSDTKIDILKIDIEGEELNLLNGGGEWLKNTNTIFLECHRDSYMLYCTLLLMDYNFKIFTSLNPAEQNCLTAYLSEDEHGL